MELNELLGKMQWWAPPSDELNVLLSHVVRALSTVQSSNFPEGTSLLLALPLTCGGNLSWPTVELWLKKRYPQIRKVPEQLVENVLILKDAFPHNDGANDMCVIQLVPRASHMYRQVPVRVLSNKARSVKINFQYDASDVVVCAEDRHLVWRARTGGYRCDRVL